MNLEENERAFVIAAVQMKIDRDKKQKQEMERKSKRKGR
jgi:hypothetical protein